MYNVLIYCFTLQNVDNDTLKEMLKKKIDQDVKLVVYNSKSRTCRGINYIITIGGCNMLWTWSEYLHMNVTMKYFCLYGHDRI